MDEEDEQREDFADLDLPPGPDPHFYWRVATAIGGLLVILAILAVVALAGIVAYQRQQPTSQPFTAP